MVMVTPRPASQQFVAANPARFNRDSRRETRFSGQGLTNRISCMYNDF
jgi:hypothetical protein